MHMIDPETSTCTASLNPLFPCWVNGLNSGVDLNGSLAFYFLFYFYEYHMIYAAALGLHSFHRQLPPTTFGLDHDSGPGRTGCLLRSSSQVVASWVNMEGTIWHRSLVFTQWAWLTDWLAAAPWHRPTHMCFDTDKKFKKKLNWSQVGVSPTTISNFHMRTSC